MSVSFYVENDIDGEYVNASNRNASALLFAIGIPEADDLCGSMEANEFAMAIRLSMMTGAAWEIVRPTVSAGNIIACGIDEQYVTEKLMALLAIAENAAREGKRVVWA